VACGRGALPHGPLPAGHSANPLPGGPLPAGPSAIRSRAAPSPNPLPQGEGACES
jgi:hypothetical protein